MLQEFNPIQCDIYFMQPFHVGMDYAPFKIPSHLAGDFSYHFVIPPFRKKSRLLRLCPCKRGHDASAALPTFCGMREGSNSLLKNTGDSFCLTLTLSKEVDCCKAVGFF